MFTTSYYLGNAEFIMLKRFLENAKRVESLGDIDIVWFDNFRKRTNSVVYSTKIRLMIDVIENIIEYNSLLFTLEDYVDKYKLSLGDFGEEESKGYRTVGELLVEEYKMPTNKSVYEWNKDKINNIKTIIEESRNELFKLINIKKKANLLYEVVSDSNITRSNNVIYTMNQLINHISLIYVRATNDEVVKVGYGDDRSDNVIVIN